MLDDGLDRLFRLAEAQQAAEDRKVAEVAALIGHNGGPVISEPFGIGADWMRAADSAELARLATLEVRIERKKQILAETISERTRIMRRCIRRIRRAAGKD